MKFKQWIEAWEDDADDNADIGFQGDFWGSAGAGVLPIAQDTGRILVQHRSSQVEQPNTWGTFGGALKAKYMRTMDFEGAAREELEEEAGSVAAQAKLVPAYQFKSGTFKYQNFIGLVPTEFEPHHTWESQGHSWLTHEELLSLPNKHFGLEALLNNSSGLIQKYAQPSV